MKIKGKYVSTVTVEFCVDESEEDLLPFDELCKAVKEQFNKDLTEIIAWEMPDGARVYVNQIFADVWRCEG